MIRTGRKEKEDAVRWLIRNLKDSVFKQTVLMGGNEQDAQLLFGDALVQLVKAIQGQAFLEQKKSIHDYLIEKIKLGWCKQLGVEGSPQRQQVFDYVSRDEDLKKRCIWQLKNLGCTPQEAEGFYHEGFLKLDELFQKQAYRGGDLKGFFKKVCYNLKRNNSRKSKPHLPGELPETLPAFDLEKSIELNNHKELLEVWLSKLSEKCRTTLQMWNDGYSYEEIAQKLNYTSKENASLARFRCMKKLIALVDL